MNLGLNLVSAVLFAVILPSLVGFAFPSAIEDVSIISAATSYLRDGGGSALSNPSGYS